MNKVLNSVIVGLILIVIGALFLVMGQAINNAPITIKISPTNLNSNRSIVFSNGTSYKLI